MKKSNYRTTGVIIGLLVGLFFGLGIINQTKKSQRSNILIYAISLSSLIGIIGGYRIGSKLDQEEFIEDQLGINKTNTEFYKNGRSWIASTKWVDLEKNSHSISTGQNSNKVLVTEYNNEVIYTHEINSGSKINVDKYHKAACNQIFKKLKDEFKR
jgi:hypothetical protein